MVKDKVEEIMIIDKAKVINVIYDGVGIKVDCEIEESHKETIKKVKYDNI